MKQRYCFRDWFTNWWMGEILALVLSILVFSVIIGILSRYGGHAVPILPYNAPLNLVISFLGILSKSLLILVASSALGQWKWLLGTTKDISLLEFQNFDEASRGFIGSTKLLNTRRLPNWTTLGAAIIVSSSIFDPSVQGLLNLSKRTTYSKSNDAVLRNTSQIPIHNYSTTAIDYPLIKLIYSAVFETSLLTAVQPYCPTGNCTWPDFTSMRLFSECEDFTELLQKSSSYNDTTIRTNSSTGFATVKRKYRYYAPKWKDVDLGWKSAKVSDISGSPFVTQDFEVDIDPRSSNGEPTLSRDLSLFLAMPLLPFDGVSSYHSNASCISSHTRHAFMRTKTDGYDVGNIVKADICYFKVCVQQVYVSFTSNRLESKMTGIPSPSEASYISAANYMSYLGPSLDEFFRGNISINRDKAGDSARVSSDIILGMDASTNISLSMQNLATALNNDIYKQSTTTIPGGQVGKEEIYVRVVWAWVTLPVTAMALCTIFLIVTMVKTRRLGARVWSNSELALIFHPAVGMDRQKSASMEQISQMQDEAKVLKMRMSWSKDEGNGHGRNFRNEASPFCT